MMSFLSGSQPFDTEVEKATSEKCTKEDWALIMEICDKIGNNSQNAKDCLRSIVRRLNAQDPHIVMLAITLLDACSSNCGKVFHLEVASREFETQFIKLINNSRQQQQPKIYEKFKSTLKKWAEGDYKSDPQLNLIPSLYLKLKSEGHDFSSTPEMQSRPNYTNKDPNFVASNQEAEELARAIELSLKESTKQSTITHSSPSTKKTTTSLYPTVNAIMATSANSEGRKVKALYDFEAVEDNELTFSAGEIIHILDDSDPNWWKGSNQRGEGLFPSNFVTADLSVEPEQYTKLESNKKSVQFSEEVEVKTVKKEPEVVEIDINEGKMDRLLHLLHEADPQSGSTDPQEMLDLEEQVTAMGPLIDTALEKVDKQHAQLTQLSSDLVEAMNLYHTLMREPAISSYTLPKMPPQQMVYPFPHPQAGPHQAGHPQHPMAGHPHAAHPHLQGPHPQAAHPQAGLPQGAHPQGAPAHMFNGMPPGPQSQMMPGPQPRYNANMPPSGEMINTQQGPTSLPSMTLPHHYYQMHPALRQMPPEARQDSPQANQNNIPYAQQGYPEQTNVGHNVSVSYMSQVPPGQPISNQQPQIASPNGQRMM